MSASLTALRDLEARLAAATGPDRELDARIWCAIEGRHFERADVEGFLHAAEIDGPLVTWSHYNRTGPLTASLDAADALRRRVLPDTWRQSFLYTTGISDVLVCFCSRELGRATRAPTEPLAILLATIRALIAREEGR